MNKSLQDQLLGAGLVDGKKAKKISKETRKAKNEKRRNKEPLTSEAQKNAQIALEEKKAKDRELNLARQAEADKKALAAQVKQMINQYKLRHIDGETTYNFNDNGIVKRLYVKNDIAEEIIRGRLCIARLEESYELIPKPVADKIKERDEDAILVYNQKTSNKPEEMTQPESDSDDAYYAQFEIPDDLTW